MALLFRELRRAEPSVEPRIRISAGRWRVPACRFYRNGTLGLFQVQLPKKAEEVRSRTGAKPFLVRQNEPGRRWKCPGCRSTNCLRQAFEFTF